MYSIHPIEFVTLFQPVGRLDGLNRNQLENNKQRQVTGDINEKITEEDNRHRREEGRRSGKTPLKPE